jgi:hypothetical protein
LNYPIKSLDIPAGGGVYLQQRFEWYMIL